VGKPLYPRTPPTALEIGFIIIKIFKKLLARPPRELWSDCSAVVEGMRSPSALLVVNKWVISVKKFLMLSSF